ncbi:hypothetical protein CL618_02330 [archaeon]|nr:hypothetical protein [archaeon]|tara:strand:+ start:80 stop:445 length:366 start_codon:yes stop_codon:yes gene_type:complete
MDPLHIKIDSPVETRKDLLKTAIETTQLLQFYENFKKIRAEKRKTIRQLRTISREIIKDVKNFKEDLPPVHIPKPKKEKSIKIPVTVKPVKIKPKPIKVPKKPVSKIQKELKEIEAKLNSL